MDSDILCLNGGIGDLNKELIAEIKNNVNIVELIGEVVALTKSGHNFLGLCPFHGEKTPSFNVVEDKQFYHCFGCGRSGDVFKFLEEYRGISFREAVQLLADRVGIVTNTVANFDMETRKNPHQELYDIHLIATKFYHTYLMTTKMGEEARAYLYQRGLTDEIIQHFQLGLAPEKGNYLYQSVGEKFSEETIANSGLFNLTDSNQVYDAFSNRIMFPLSNDQGKVVAFSGRIWKPVDGSQPIAKYKNSRSTVIFNKSFELYHLDKAKQSIKKYHEVYLMEGYMDVIAAYRAGIENAVASMGTALSHEHVEHLKRFTKKIILTYDGDKAGQAATEKALSELDDFSVDIVTLPGGMDPDEFLQKNSANELKTLLEKTRISKIEFLIQHLKPDNLENLQAQISFVEQISPIIAQEPSLTAQNTYIYKLVELLPDFDYQQVESTINDVRVNQRQEKRIRNTIKKQAIVELPVSKQLSRLILAESHLLNRMIYNSVLLNNYRLREDFSFDTPELASLYQILCDNGEVTSQDLAMLPEETQRAWYGVLEQNLPADWTQEELDEVERIRETERLKRETTLMGRRVREASHQGDFDTATDELEKLIAQKRKME
ncbi:DNA primase [Streptococcus sp. DD10]|uniref:DNA primase n=1 Tax=Streptococcus sp. DD10 TaxID=1777878 RepID=UPI000798F6F4|nr:DNA primase [Streptococcus sp. DD10]KXT77086.1 DNA primase [Streptococcus sp. DD10]